MRSVSCLAYIAALATTTLAAQPLWAEEPATEMNGQQLKNFLAECISLTTILASGASDQGQKGDLDLMVQAFSEGLAKYANVRSSEEVDNLMNPSMARVRGYLSSNDPASKEKTAERIGQCNAIVLVARKYAALKNGAN